MRKRAVSAVSGVLFRVRGDVPRAVSSTVSFTASSTASSTVSFSASFSSASGPTETSTGRGRGPTSRQSTTTVGQASTARCLPPLCGGCLQASVAPLPCTPRYMHTPAASGTLATNSRGPGPSDNKHLELTARQTRHELVSSGEVVRLWQQSDWVKCFDIRVDHPDFQFKAGQWVDTFIPGIDVVGGFSLCTAPHELHSTRTITLGIKAAQWPPAKWFFEQCRVGSVVELRVGGDFFLDCPTEAPRPVLLVGGGVGINPLAAMFRHAAHHTTSRGRVALLFSAREEQDLLYKSELDSLCVAGSELSVDYYITREQLTTAEDNIHSGRITKATLAEALSRLCADKSPADTTSQSNHTTNSGSTIGIGGNGEHRASGSAEQSTEAVYDNSGRDTRGIDSVDVFVCGPPVMITAVEQHLLNLGLRQAQIRYEKWW